MRAFRRDLVYFCYMFQNKSHVDQRIPQFISSLDSCIYSLLSTDNFLEKGEAINSFLDENLNTLFDLRSNFFVKFTHSFIHRIRKKIDKYLKKIEASTEINLHTNPEIIAAQQLLTDFFNPTDLNSIPEPIDFVSIYKDALVRLKIEKHAPKSELKFLHDYYSTYKAIFSIIQQIPWFSTFKDEFMLILAAEKLPIKYSFIINDEIVEYSFTVHSTVYNAKVAIAPDLGVPSDNITIRCNQNSKFMINEMPLTFYSAPFTVEYIPPPPIKYRFMTPKRNVSKLYDYTKTVFDVKNDLRLFLQHEVQCSVNGKILEDHQKLSSLQVKNLLIEVTFTPDYKFHLPNNEILEDSFQANTSMFSVYSSIRQKLDFSFLLYNGESLITDYSAPVGNVYEFNVIKTSSVCRFFKFPHQNIKMLQFEENDTVEKAKEVLKKDFNLNESEFVLTVNNKVLKRLTMPLLHVQSCDIISIKPTDSLLIHFLTSNNERYEIRFKQTATIKEAKQELSNLFNCEFYFIKKDKVMKDSKLLILISPPLIKVEMALTVYHFQFPNGKNKKHEFPPTMTVQEMKKFVAIHQKTEIDNIQLYIDGKMLKDRKYLYDIDCNSLITISVLVTLQFYIQSKNKQSTKSLPFDITATIKDVRQFFSIKTRHNEDKFSFFNDDNEMISDETLLRTLDKEKVITVIIAQKDPEFDETEINEIEKHVTSVFSKDEALSFYVKCGKNFDRFLKNLPANNPTV
ncbi:hypothetical protein TRFO_37555 [Tritrichomonas foetus]|uniref:Ubiquitin-like domain-containing protein n=1 Tax=Tritrichomonas foetus TaxID=1144522 RepID=A0A1J4JAS1_9EUKA|nr:hypothetical protein TRFO_37555 [Tritrichomonas foetus]|eukprot:OHS96282.1 hypothetical protein TRFO_37555 [Tritrichomonas foetus]